VVTSAARLEHPSLAVDLTTFVYSQILRSRRKHFNLAPKAPCPCKGTSEKISSLKVLGVINGGIPCHDNRRAELATRLTSPELSKLCHRYLGVFLGQLELVKLLPTLTLLPGLWCIFLPLCRRLGAPSQLRFWMEHQLGLPMCLTVTCSRFCRDAYTLRDIT